MTPMDNYFMSQKFAMYAELIRWNPMAPVAVARLPRGPQRRQEMDRNQHNDVGETLSKTTHVRMVDATL